MVNIIDNTYELIKLTPDCNCGTTWKYPNIHGITYYPVCDKCKTKYVYTCGGNAKRYRLQSETVRLWNDIIKILSNYNESVGVRQLFYQLVKIGWPKTEKFSKKVSSETGVMRKRGVIPFDSFSDSTRFYHKQRSYNGLAEALEYWQDNYRRAIWLDLDFLVEVWIEKLGLINTVFPVTNEFDIPLMPCKGFASISSLYDVAKNADIKGKHIIILYLGDFDPSGELISDTIKDTLSKFQANVSLVRIALNSHHIDLWNLPTRPTKDTNHSRKFESEVSVELDSVDPDTLRNELRLQIESIIPKEVLEGVRKIEAAEKDTLAKLSLS